MQEVFTESIRLVNLPFTALLVGLLIYWLLVMVGLLQFDTGADADIHVGGDAGMDVGSDVQVHGDVGADLEAGMGGSGTEFGSDGGGGEAGVGQGEGAADHGDAGPSHGPSLVASVMKFVNLGDVPAMIVVSVQALCMWVFAMIANHYWNDHSVVRGLVFVVPNVLLSAVVTRYLTWPMAKFFRALNREYDEHRPLLGRTCIITTSEVTDAFGQARVETRGAPLLINVRTTESRPLQRGDTGLIVREETATHLYYVRRVSPEKLEI